MFAKINDFRVALIGNYFWVRYFLIWSLFEKLVKILGCLFDKKCKFYSSSDLKVVSQRLKILELTFFSTIFEYGVFCFWYLFEKLGKYLGCSFFFIENRIRHSCVGSIQWPVAGYSRIAPIILKLPCKYHRETPRNVLLERCFFL